MSKSVKFLLVLLKYSFFFVCFISLNSIVPNAFGATSLFVGLLYANCSPILLSLTFATSFAIAKTYQALAIGIFQAVFLGGIYTLYSVNHKKPSVEIVLYFFVSQLPYILWGGDIVQKLVYSSIICLFSFISISSTNVVSAIIKRAKPQTVDSIAISIMFVLCGVGFINIFGINVYKAFAVLALLFSMKSFEKYAPYAISGVLAAPLAIVSLNAGYFCALFVWYIFASIFINSKRFIAAAALLSGEAIMIYLIGFYSSYGVVDALCVAIPALFFGFLPNSIFDRISEKLSFKPNELLCYGYINKTRSSLSSKLYEISGVFFQMQSAFSELKKCSLSKEIISEKILIQTITSACSNCVLKERCEMRNFPDKETLKKIINLGIVKGRVTLIDIPREFTDVCGYPNSVIFEINRLISEFCEQIKSADGVDDAKQIVGLQVEGLGKIMKGLALDLSKSISYDRTREKTIMDIMRKHGMPLSGALIIGEGNTTELSVFVDANTASKPAFCNYLSEIIGTPLAVSRWAQYNDNLVAITYTKRSSLDAVFGISSVTKNNSTVCGDTHSMIKIDDSRFLVALSDGMGSGDKAEQTSSTALNLIESFYRAKLDSELILKTVNKVLAMNVDDNFAAVDIGIVNLNEASCDLIKIGAPYGFIITESGIKYIEGSSLPLGILEELKPSSISINVNSNDVIVMLSDGITDAFGSSTEMIEFLKTAPLKNPQALSDSIISKALFLSNGIACDDMTALCVRLVEKNSKVAV